MAHVRLADDEARQERTESERDAEDRRRRVGDAQRDREDREGEQLA